MNKKNLPGKQNLQQSIQFVVNYWEYKPTAIGKVLDRLMQENVQELVSFVPWQAVESDVSHTLSRYIQAATERNLPLSLILTPEVGVGFSHSGLPRDLVQRQDQHAKAKDGTDLSVFMAPNFFPLLSLNSHEFKKRYNGFLSRMDHLLSDLAKNNYRISQNVKIIVTGSFWKYYRSPSDSQKNIFGGTSGDYSTNSALLYRQSLEQHYSVREFNDPTPTASNRWKSKSLEEMNHRWYNQQCEDFFRARTEDILKRKSKSFELKQIELFTPEADPSVFYSNYLHFLTGVGGDFQKFAKILDSTVTRRPEIVREQKNDLFESQKSLNWNETDLESENYQAEWMPPWVHWSQIGSFRSLTDSEKQYLILKSILLAAGRGGGVFIDTKEWLSLSANFRARAEILAKTVSQGELKLFDQVTYLSPHLWSSPGMIWESLESLLPFRASIITKLESLKDFQQSTLCIIDPQWTIDLKTIECVLQLARAGRVVVLPKSVLYTEIAKRELAGTLAGDDQSIIQMKQGIEFEVFQLGSGKILVYDIPDGLDAFTQSEKTMGGALWASKLSQWKEFVSSLLHFAGIEEYCHVSDSRLKLIPMKRAGGELAVFVLNATSRTISADLVFTCDVRVSDLATALGAAYDVNHGKEVTPAHRFSLEVPSCGILPIAVDGFSADARESRVAQLTDSFMVQHLEQAAFAELPGMSAASVGLGKEIDDLFSVSGGEERRFEFTEYTPEGLSELPEEGPRL